MPYHVFSLMLIMSCFELCFNRNVRGSAEYLSKRDLPPLSEALQMRDSPLTCPLRKSYI